MASISAFSSLLPLPVNMTFREGCVGFTTRILPALHPVSLVQVDEETEAVVRGADGLCVHCQPGEPGQLVGRIPPKDRFLQFDGYANQQVRTTSLSSVDVNQQVGTT